MKKIMVMFLATIIFVCSVSSAFAENWVEIAKSNDYLISIDATSLDYNGTTIQVREKWVPINENISKKLSKDFKSALAYILHHTEYDVNYRTSRNLGTTYYDKNGNMLRNNPEDTKGMPISPSTNIDTLLNLYKELFDIHRVGSSPRAINWIELGHTDNVIMYYDSSSLQCNDNTIHVWEKWVYRNENAAKEASQSLKKTAAYQLMYLEYDVKNRTYRILRLIRCDKNSNVMSKAVSGQNDKRAIPADETTINIYKKSLKIQ